MSFKIYLVVIFMSFYIAIFQLSLYSLFAKFGLLLILDSYVLFGSILVKPNVSNMPSCCSCAVLVVFGTSSHVHISFNNAYTHQVEGHKFVRILDFVISCFILLENV